MGSVGLDCEAPDPDGDERGVDAGGTVEDGVGGNEFICELEGEGVTEEEPNPANPRCCCWEGGEVEDEELSKEFTT